MLSLEQVVKDVLPSARLYGVNCKAPNKTVILLRSGHGGKSGGARAFDGTPEWWINHKIARELFTILPYKHQLPVIWLNPDAPMLPNWLREGVSYANKIHKALGMDCFFVSIHCNSFYPKGWSRRKPYNRANGFEVFYKSKSCRTYMVANKVCNSVVNTTFGNTVLKKRGPKVGDRYYEIKNTTMPAVLVECGFVNSEKDLRVLLGYRKQLAASIAEGLNNALSHERF